MTSCITKYYDNVFVFWIIDDNILTNSTAGGWGGGQVIETSQWPQFATGARKYLHKICIQPDTVTDTGLISETFSSTRGAAT